MSDTFKHKIAGKAKRQLKLLEAEQEGIAGNGTIDISLDEILATDKDSKLRINPKVSKNFPRSEPLKMRTRTARRTRRLQERTLIKRGEYEAITPKRPQEETKRLWVTP